MNRGPRDDLSGQLKSTLTGPAELERIIRSFLRRFSIAVAKVHYDHGVLDCAVQGPLDALQSVSIGVVRESLREWLPTGVEFRITTLGEAQAAAA